LIGRANWCALAMMLENSNFIPLQRLLLEGV
jgi:hypothetical protein